MGVLLKLQTLYDEVKAQNTDLGNVLYDLLFKFLVWQLKCYKIYPRHHISKGLPSE